MTASPIQRRSFLSLLGGVAGWPLGAVAQQDRKRRPRVAALFAGTANDPVVKERVAAFTTELERLGWLSGRNLQIEYRFALTAPRETQEAAKELVSLHPDVIFVQSTPFAAALQSETSEIPIVFVSVSDPIGSGFVSSLRRPGGSLTGFLLYEEGIVGKWIAMLKEVMPSIARVGLLGDPSIFLYFSRAATAPAPSR